MEPSDALSFNNGKHSRGDWDTTLLAWGKGPLRAAAGFLSAKRQRRHPACRHRAKAALRAGCGRGNRRLHRLVSCAHAVHGGERRHLPCRTAQDRARARGERRCRPRASGVRRSLRASVPRRRVRRGLFHRHAGPCCGCQHCARRTRAHQRAGRRALSPQRMRRLPPALARPCAYRAPGGRPTRRAGRAPRPLHGRRPAGAVFPQVPR